MSPAHHELPVLYLRGFCIPPTGTLWVYARKLDTTAAAGPTASQFRPGGTSRHNPRKRSVHAVALRADHYVGIRPDGTQHYDYEAALQKSETRADSALRRVRSRASLTSTDKDAITGYILVLLRRVASRDAAMRQRIADSRILDSWSREAREQAELGEFARARASLQRQEWFVTDLLRQSMFLPQHAIRSLLLARKWRFLTAPRDKVFVTGDHPLVYDKRGLFNPPLLFPLGSHVLLEVDDDGDADLIYQELSTDAIDRINTLIMLYAQEHIYASVADSDIAGTFSGTEPLPP